MFSQVKKGLDALLFNLLILGMLKSSSGEVWRRSSSDLYVIELTIGQTPGVNETVHHSKVSFRKVFIYYQHTHGPRGIDSALKVLLYEMLHDL